ncbi:winged helix-turn-helix domain-containing protein [Pseudarthrobacter albicanus]|uniref:winged helix-turn-helix domain-containing protein n=1 Tax=Pseudarthrobacter albicanus TaxID=2823873 RepID=UPI001BABAE0D|nr:winged helix-turn-helix domain-containing protein [Pseudarthrobacter albicanus]
MTTDFEIHRSMDVHHIERPERAPSRPIRSQIVEYLASNGASKVADISNGIASSRGSVRYHLAALETASIVRSNISPGARCRFTPFYALAPEKPESGS